jgi:hypothetical protein
MQPAVDRAIPLVPFAPKRRWFQFSLRELFALTSLLGIAWWRLANWTTTMDVSPGQKVETSIGEVSFPGFAEVTLFPSPRQIAFRWAAATLILIAVWIIGRERIRRFSQRPTDRR